MDPTGCWWILDLLRCTNTHLELVGLLYDHLHLRVLAQTGTAHLGHLLVLRSHRRLVLVGVAWRAEGGTGQRRRHCAQVLQHHGRPSERSWVVLCCCWGCWSQVCVQHYVTTSSLIWTKVSAVRPDRSSRTNVNPPHSYCVLPFFASWLAHFYFVHCTLKTAAVLLDL